MKTWTIYKHTLILDCNHKGWSYIGLTSQDVAKRWQKGLGYTEASQEVFYRAIKKYGWNNFSHEILEKNISTLEEANQREQYWIKYFHTYIHDPFCNGYNMTVGGDSISVNRLITIQKDNELKKIYKKDLSQYLDLGWKILSKNERVKLWRLRNNDKVKEAKKVYAKEHKEALTKYKQDYYQKNKEKIKAQCKQKYIKSPNGYRKQIICIETQEIFNSITEAQNKYGKGIDKCLIGQCKSARGYHWAFVNDLQTQELYRQFIGSSKNNKIKSVRCIETNIIYSSASEAFKVTGIYHIDACCRGERLKAGGYHWEYLQED